MGLGNGLKPAVLSLTEVMAAIRSAQPECARCSAPGGWLDRSAIVNLKPVDRDLFVGWSPTPDCHGE